MNEVRIGFVGAGWVAQKHAAVLQGIEGAHVVAVAARRAEAAESLAAKSAAGARTYTNALEMLDREQLNALYICLPPNVHGAIERAAIERGIPFLVEKPLAVTYETAEEIDQAVTAAGLLTSVGYHWRYLETTERAKEQLAELSVRLAIGSWLGSTPPPEWWRRQDRSGGQMIEQTTHIFDLARYLLGEVTMVYAAGSHTSRAAYPDLDVDDVSVATLTFASGAVGTLSSTCLLRDGHRVGLDLFGDGFAIELSDREILIDRDDERTMDRCLVNPFIAENRAFIDAVRGEPNRIRSSYADALKTHRVTTLALASSREQRALPVP